MASKYRKTLLYGAPLAALLVLAGVLYVNRLQADARLLAQVGREHQQLLERYKKAIEQREIEQISACYDDLYASTNGGFWEEELRSERDGVRVYHWGLKETRPFARADVIEQVKRYLRRIGSLEESKWRLDLVEEIPHADAAVIRSFLWLRGTNLEDEVFESQVVLRMWTRKVDGEWKINKQELVHGVTTTGTGQGFSDVTAAAGLDFVAGPNPRWATPEWSPRAFGLVVHTTAGVASADYDNDGWDDLLFANGDGLLLYHNDGDGTFTEATAAAGLPSGPHGIVVGLFADFDNDGDGTFTDASAKAHLGDHFVAVAAVADYDNDGRLDLYLGRYLDPRKNLPTTLFYTRNSEGNSLLRNLGDLRFEDVTEAAGVRDGGLALGIAWGDYDRDGQQDFYVANDFGRNALFHNNGDGTFTDVAAASGTLDFGFGMSASFGDIDNDGDLDLYVSNVHSAQRWYGQAAVLYQYLLTSVWQGTILEDFPLYKEILTLAGSSWNSFGDRMVKGNSLLINDGQGHFTDLSEATHTNPFGWYWSSAIFDFDNDGRQDLYAVNGWISAKSKDDL
jgi:hypothetical protein